jgi:hypothetical protein
VWAHSNGWSALAWIEKIMSEAHDIRENRKLTMNTQGKTDNRELSEQEMDMVHGGSSEEYYPRRLSAQIITRVRAPDT